MGREGDATKNFERGLLSICCNPYTGSRMVNQGSKVQCGKGEKIPTKPKVQSKISEWILKKPDGSNIIQPQPHPHTQPRDSSGGTPGVASNQPTNTATGKEHHTLHSNPKEPEGTSGELTEGGEATCTKFTTRHTTKFIPEKGQFSTCGDAGTISLPLAKARSHTEVGGREVCSCNGTTSTTNVCHKNFNTYTTNHSLATGNPG